MALILLKMPPVFDDLPVNRYAMPGFAISDELRLKKV